MQDEVWKPAVVRRGRTARWEREALAEVVRDPWLLGHVTLDGAKVQVLDGQTRRQTRQRTERGRERSCPSSVRSFHIGIPSTHNNTPP